MALRASFALVTLVTTTGLVLLGCPFSSAGIMDTGGNGGGTSSSTSSQGGMTSSSTSHTSSTSSATCMPSGTESCTDGIDNDCNGKTDCEDDACATLGFACSPPAAAGWTVVDFSMNAGAPCATGYGSPQQGQELPTIGSTDCACSCDPAPQGLCSKGQFDVNFGYVACAGPQVSFTSDGGCDAIGAAIGGNDSSHNSYHDDYMSAPPAPMQVACGSHTSLPALTPGKSGRWCTPTGAMVGGGCSAGACMPKVDPASWCLMTTDKAMPMCPTGFDNRLVLYATSDIHDGRQCGTCTCASNATSCSNPSLTVYPDNTCNNNGVPINTATSCQNYPNNNMADIHTYAWFKYSATPDKTDCSPTTQNVMATGSLTGDNPITICCPQ